MQARRKCVGEEHLHNWVELGLLRGVTYIRAIHFKEGRGAGKKLCACMHMPTVFYAKMATTARKNKFNRNLIMTLKYIDGKTSYN